MRMLRRYAIVGMTIGFASGIVFRSFFDLGSAFIGFGIVVAIALLVIGLTRKHSFGILIALVILSGVAGILRFDAVQGMGVDPFLETQVSKTVTMRGVVIDEPDERSDHTNLTVAVRSVRSPERRSVDDARVRVVAPAYPEWQYGDVVRLSGQLVKPDPFYDERNGRWFDYPHFLAKDGIRYTMTYPEIERTGTGAGNPVIAALFSFKEAFLKSVSRTIPEPHAALLGGLVVGAKQSLGEALLADFRETGIIHIVVLSGYNVTIVAETIRRVLAFLPFYASLGSAIASIAAFAIMTGAEAPVVRASIMAIFVLLARATGRSYMVVRALLAAALVMLIHNPYIVLYDVAFQLSFVATIGLIYLSPWSRRLFPFLPERFGLRDVAAATIATQIFVLPLLLYHTGMLSLVSLPVNMLILIFVPLTMLLGFVTGVIGMVHTTLALPFAALTYLLLSYELGVVDLFADTSLTAFSVDAFPAFIVVIVYLIYAGGCIMLGRRMQMRGDDKRGE